MNVNNTSVLITGGSRGLGRAIAKELTQAGARAVLVARHRADLDTVVEEIRRAGGIAYGIAADTGGKNQIYPIAGQSMALAGPTDILIVNASTLGPVPLRPLLDTDCEVLEAVLNVNLIGPFRLIKAVTGSMAMRGRGLVLTISSDAAVEAYPDWGAYAVSKAGLDHLTRIFAVELAGTGVQFLSIDPGEMNTQMHRDAVPHADSSILAAPETVAARICEIIKRSDQFRSGSRIVASAVGVA